MVDDTMDISGHDDEHGDIDIDLDLTGDAVDEDSILEDATSHVDDGNYSHPQHSTAVNDDVMIDDDSESFQMEDAMLEEETEHIIEQETISFAADVDASYYGINDQVGEQSISDDTNGISYEGYDTVKDESLGFDLQQELDAVLPQDSHQELVEPNSSSAEHVAPGTEIQASRNSSPSQQCPHPSAPTEPRSPPASVLEPGPSPSRSTHDTDLASPHDADNSRVDNPLTQDSSSLDHVIVTYREVEYTLFSASEHDDPDQYFLSDKTIAEKPLSEFFGAIREIIRADLVDEDELCIVVESLGLQAEEISPSTNEVTLLQVLSLHAKLVENDGLDVSGGCHIVLKTRTNFCRRFSNLVTAAAEGKGLSQFAYWDDQSIHLDDSEDLEETKYDFEDDVEGRGLGEPSEHYDEHQQYDGTEADGFGQDLVTREDGPDDFHKSENEAEIVQSAVLPEVASSGGNALVVTPKSTALKLPQNSMERESDVDEDDDLIDYSEDEDVITEEKRKAAVRNSENNGTAAEEFEQRDELLRRRSFDRRQSSAAAVPEEHEVGAKKAVLEHQRLNDVGDAGLHSEKSGLGQDENDHQFEKEDYTDQNEVGYEQVQPQQSEHVGENSYEHFDSNNLEYDHEQTEDEALASTISAPVGIENDENDENDAALEQYGDGGEYIEADLDPDYAIQQGANDESVIAHFKNDDLDFEVGEGSFLEESKQKDESLELNGTNGQTSAQEASKASSLDVVDTAESSVTMGPDEIQYEDDFLEEANHVVEFGNSTLVEVKASPQEVVEEKDEIDYEEDDEEAELSLQSPTLVSEDHEYQNANGKRSIADVESNDSQTSEAKDAKRPRS